MKNRFFTLILLLVCALNADDRPLTLNGVSRPLQGWQVAEDPYFNEADVYEWLEGENAFRKMTLQEFLGSEAAQSGEFSWHQFGRTLSRDGLPSLFVPKIIVNGHRNERAIRKMLVLAMP